MLSIIEKFEEYEFYFGNYKSIGRSQNKFYLPLNLIVDYTKNQNIFLSELLLLELEQEAYQNII